MAIFNSYVKLPEGIWKVFTGLPKKKRFLSHHLPFISRLLWSRSSPSRSVISLWSHPLSTSASPLPIRLLGMSRVDRSLMLPEMFSSAAEVAFHFFLFSMVPGCSIHLHPSWFHRILSGPLYIWSKIIPLSSTLSSACFICFFPAAILGYTSFINQSFEAALGSHPIPDAPCMY